MSDGQYLHRRSCRTIYKDCFYGLMFQGLSIKNSETSGTFDIIPEHLIGITKIEDRSHCRIESDNVPKRLSRTY